MEIATLVNILDQPHLAADQLHAWGLKDARRGQQALLELAETGLSLDLLAELSEQLAAQLPALADPDAALAAFTRFLLASRSPLAVAALFQRDPAALPMLLRALSLGPDWARLLAESSEAFDLLRETEGAPANRAGLLAEISAELEELADERSLAAALARFQHWHTLRIAYAEMFGQQRFELAVAQLSAVTEVTVEAALAAAVRRALALKPLPRQIDPDRQRHCIIALGRLGGGECDYSRALKLLFVYESSAGDAAHQRAVAEHYERVAKLTSRLLLDADPRGALHQVTFVPLPDSQAAAWAHAVEDAAFGFDAYGRTWHREELVNARPISGDIALGQSLLGRLDSWRFRRYLNAADETGIQAMKRRVLVNATLHQDERRNVSLARGGLANIESTVRLLQLLVGGDRPRARAAGTLAAIAELEQGGTLTVEERSVLEQSYVALRQIEHRQQISAGHRADLPADLDSRLNRSWQALSKLLGSAFAEEPAAPREVELLLDPSPPDEEVRAALAPFGFSDAPTAMRMVQHLAEEQIPFLSTRRCRHALAQILPQLLCAVAATPSPDQTLDNLVRVSNSLGGKGVLWELFRFHPPSLQLYVKLCAASPYLSNLLTTNPGMLDELVDSLQLQHLPTRSQRQAMLAELCRGASDTLPIVHDFKNAQHLRIGVRDILGKEPIERTHQALADVADICLDHVSRLEFARLVEKFGLPTLGPGPREGEVCQFVVLGLEKLGGREPNYHSDLNVVFLYEAEGTTQPQLRSRRDQKTANNHFFTQLAQRILKEIGLLTPKGRLYAIDAQMRPIGVGGALALSMADFGEHFARGTAPLWQWRALCQARAVVGDDPLQGAVMALVQQLLCRRQPGAGDRQELLQARQQLERGASPDNLKRAPGGTLDIEFLVQILQLENAGAHPEVLVPGTQDALDKLVAAGLLPPADAEQLGDAYRFLRRVESGLRLLETAARHDLPSDGLLLGQLAVLVGYSNPGKLPEVCRQLMAGTRATFRRLLGPLEGQGPQETSQPCR